VSESPEDAAADQYGVVGHPIGHSWSPFIHGMFAKETSQHMVYRLFDIPPEDFRREVLRLFTSGIAGLNVTVPHKQEAADLVNELTPRAARAKAVNTIALFKKSGLIGDNTDGIGLLADLERNIGLDLSQKRVLMLGAGGAARGVLAPLLERDLKELVIANRTPGRSRGLAAEFSDLGNVRGCGFGELEGPPFDLIINATAASLQGEMPAMHAGIVGNGSVCYDMAYGRGETPFTAWAQSLNAAHSCKGWGMLVEQAAASFELWRGVRPSTRPVLDVLTQFR
jgi:shikimate dehydrogenase